MARTEAPPRLETAIPMPLQIVIDDVGWWSGENGHERGEPFRTGIERSHVPADYAALASLGKRLGMRPQAAIILCEWDRDNILRKLPSATWMGRDWDNRRWVGPWLDEAAGILADNRAHIELTLHGVGHEFWGPDGSMTRAEWHDAEGNMRPRDQVLAHLDYFQLLLDQNQLGPFPESFVPAAFRHCFGRGEAGLDAILRDAGVRHISTPFHCMDRVREPRHELFGIDCGLMTVNRGSSFPPWHELDSTPVAPAGPILGLHWPNVLHADPARNEEVVSRWGECLAAENAKLERWLAPDTAACWGQLRHWSDTRVEPRDGGLRLHLADAAARQVVVKLAGPANLVFEAGRDSGVRLEVRYDAASRLHTLVASYPPDARAVEIAWQRA